MSAPGRIPAPRELRVLGGRVHAVEPRQAVALLEERVAAGERQFVVAQNPEKILRCEQDSELARILDERATLVIADGVGVVLAARVLGLGRLERLTGVDLFQELLAAAAASGRSVFLYGARPEVSEGAAREAARRHPTLCIAGVEHGYEPDEARVVERVRRARPDYLFVALGTPRQEKWIARHLDELPVGCALGVGGSFDVLAGAVRRAPALMRRTGTEWLHRLLTQPSRAGRMRALPRFAWRVARARLRGASAG